MVKGKPDKLMKWEKLVDLKDAKDRGITTVRIYMDLPLEESHQNHIVRMNEGSGRRLHPKVKEKIYEHVLNGITQSSVVQMLLKQYVEEELLR